MKSSPFALKQKLSSKAAAAKKRRDIAMAKTPARKAKKAENQRIGQRSDSDLHHTGSTVKRVSIKNNRGNFGKGTKNETKGSGFKLRSGNKTSFKMMGSGTYDDAGIYQASTDDMRVGSREYADARAINRTWTNQRGVTMYRHPDGSSSSIPYDPAKVGVAVRGDSRGYFDYKGQAATSGIEELKNRQNRGRRRRSTTMQTFFGGNKPDPLSNLSNDDFWSQYSF